jgi:hypothetical protein
MRHILNAPLAHGFHLPPEAHRGIVLSELFNHPLVIFAVTLIAMGVSVHAGALYARMARPVQDHDKKEDMALISNASLVLLALIIGFTFSMAVTRYDLRKNYEEEEANAIGTEYLRVDLLPASDAAAIRQLLIQYVDQRVVFYSSHDPQQLREVDRETAGVQAEMWSSVRRAATADPTPPVALAVSGMNDALNRQSYTQAAWWNRIPYGAWSLMITLAVTCNLLIGYAAPRMGAALLTVLPFLVAVSFFLIADIDSPRDGVIRLTPQNLISLAESLHAAPK